VRDTARGTLNDGGKGVIAQKLLDLSKAVIGVLPTRWAVWLGARLGLLAYVLDRKRRRIARANVAYTIGADRAYRDISRVARLSFCHQGMRFVEFLRLGKYIKRGDPRHASVVGEENLRKAFSGGKGVVFLTSPLGSSGIASATVCLLGYPCIEVVCSATRGRLEQVVGRAYARLRFMTGEDENVKSGLIARLRRNEGVCVGIDDKVGGGRVCVKFIGRPVAASTLAAELAMETDAAVVPVFLLRHGRGQHKLVFEAALEALKTGSLDEDLPARTVLFCRVVGRYVNKHPEQWPWMEKTWRPPRSECVRKRFRDVDRILVKMPNWLGDAVMSVPAVDCLRRLFPRAWIACLIQEKIADVVRNNNALDEVIAYRHGSGAAAWGRKVKTIRRLRRNFFDLAVLLTNSFESALWMYLSGIPLRLGYRAAGRGFLLTHNVPRKPSPVHQIEYYLKLCEALGEAGFSCAPRVRLTEQDRNWAADFLSSVEVSEQDVLVGLCPGAAYGPAKRWLPGRFIEVNKRICDHHPAKFMVFGGEGDEEPCSVVADGIGEKATNLCGKTTLRELAALIDRCAVVISNDSGSMHLAAAIGTPTIGIFGSTDPARSAPPENCTVIKKEIACSPCSRRECPTDFRCMTSISAEEIFRKVTEILSRRAVKGASDSTVERGMRPPRGRRDRKKDAGK